MAKFNPNFQHTKFRKQKGPKQLLNRIRESAKSQYITNKKSKLQTTQHPKAVGTTRSSTNKK